jgi:tRNA1Val (adenine37-N6)-methyltransferase
MKIGTDAILLGTWANIENTEKILDIGTGCGIIALMLAQRSKVSIDAVEIDKNSALQAVYNFNHSQWVNKMRVFNTSFQTFVNSVSAKYDVIVSNPPYFRDALKSDNSLKNLARHTDTLSFEDLITGISELLSPQGKACMILPVTESITLKRIAEFNGLFCNHQTEVISRKGFVPNRLLMEFCKVKRDLKENSLCILNEDLSYTDEFIVLTKDFYLNF